jgi:hypothetical protein
MNIDASLSPSEKARWRLVRMDDFTDVPGQIVTANETTGNCWICCGFQFSGAFNRPGGTLLSVKC